MIEKDNYRPIRSYVLRQSRLTKSQANAIKKLSEKYIIPFSKKFVNWNDHFSNKKGRRIIEIGFGMGTTTSEIAQQFKFDNFIGIEVHSPGVGNLLNLIIDKDLKNLKIIQKDAVEVFESMIKENSLDGIHIFFPDPWHKKRHNKRRLIQKFFLKIICKALKKDAYLHIATDWEDYANWIICEINKFEGLDLKADDYFTKPIYRPDTKYEKRGLKLGHKVWDILSVKR